MQCTNCGMPITQDVDNCPRCGSSISFAEQTKEVSYIEYSSSSRAKDPPPAPPINSAPPRQYPPVTPMWTGNPSRRAVLVSAQQNLPFSPPPHQLTPRPRRYSPLSLVLLVILLVLLLISGIGLTYYAAVTLPSELHKQSIAVLHTVLTAQARETAQATANAQATTAALTPDQLYARATSGIPVINDPLNNAATGIWFHSTKEQSCVYLDGSYHIRPSLASSGIYCPSYNAFFTNLAFQAQMTIIAPGAGGLVFNIQGFSTSSNYYTFFIDSTGNYTLELYKDGGYRYLLSGSNTAIHSGLNQTNLLTVVAFDSQIYLYCNKVLLGHIEDHTSTSGQLALVAGSITNSTTPTNVAFKNVQVWSL